MQTRDTPVPVAAREPHVHEAKTEQMTLPTELAA